MQPKIKKTKEAPQSPFFWLLERVSWYFKKKEREIKNPKPSNQPLRSRSSQCGRARQARAEPNNFLLLDVFARPSQALATMACTRASPVNGHRTGPGSSQTSNPDFLNRSIFSIPCFVCVFRFQELTYIYFYNITQIKFPTKNQTLNSKDDATKSNTH